MITIKEKGIQDYTSTWQEMVSFTENRTKDTQDELWTLEHNSVFTQGLTGKSEHLLKETEIEVIQSDRGGQITYHGPGQIIVYCLIDIKRLGIGVKQMVSIIEKSVCSIIENYVGKLHENQISLKNSSKGKYVSITVRIIATSRKQLDSINADLQKSPLVSYLL